MTVCANLGCYEPASTVYKSGDALCITHAHQRGSVGLAYPPVLPPLPAPRPVVPPCSSPVCLVSGCPGAHEERGCCEVHAVILRNAPSPAATGVLCDQATRLRLSPFWPHLLEADGRIKRFTQEIREEAPAPTESAFVDERPPMWAKRPRPTGKPGDRLEAMAAEARARHAAKSADPAPAPARTPAPIPERVPAPAPAPVRAQAPIEKAAPTEEPVAVVEPHEEAAVAVEESEMKEKCPVHVEKRQARHGVCETCLTAASQAGQSFEARAFVPSNGSNRYRAVLAIDLDSAHKAGWVHTDNVRSLRDAILNPKTSKNKKPPVHQEESPHPQPAMQAAPAADLPQGPQPVPSEVQQAEDPPGELEAEHLITQLEAPHTPTHAEAAAEAAEAGAEAAEAGAEVTRKPDGSGAEVLEAGVEAGADPVEVGVGALEASWKPDGSGVEGLEELAAWVSGLQTLLAEVNQAQARAFTLLAEVASLERTRTQLADELYLGLRLGEGRIEAHRTSSIYSGATPIDEDAMRIAIGAELARQLEGRRQQLWAAREEVEHRARRLAAIRDRAEAVCHDTDEDAAAAAK